MRSTKFSGLRTIPLYLFLLPIFFVLHGFGEFYDLISPLKASILLLYYLLGTLIVLLISRLLLKTYPKAAPFSFSVMCLYFFFGSFQDLLFKKFPGTFITSYSFVLSLILVFFIILFFILKKTKKPLYKITLYLNILLAFLILIDTVSLILKVKERKRISAVNDDLNLKVCPSCRKPDIYLIVADGYSGKIPLQKFFNYNNLPFENELKQRGFFVADSSFSNYNYTAASIGSLLNMSYLNIRGYYNGKVDLPLSFNSIKQNKLCEYLRKENYQILNYSIFDIKDTRPKIPSTILNFEKTPLVTQTFLYRVNRDLGYHLITTLKLKFLQQKIKKDLEVGFNGNKMIDSLTKNIGIDQSGQPKFVYSHFVMPHFPYYFDSSGKRVPNYIFTETYNTNKNAYISYLKYANKRLLNLIDTIRQNNTRETIIILLGDHGCRECLESTPDRGNAELLNLNAVYFPDKNYSQFYKGLSNVNLFRIILNTQFKKNLPLRKDSMTLMKKEQ